MLFCIFMGEPLSYHWALTLIFLIPESAGWQDSSTETGTVPYTALLAPGTWNVQTKMEVIISTAFWYSDPIWPKCFRASHNQKGAQWFYENLSCRVLPIDLPCQEQTWWRTEHLCNAQKLNTSPADLVNLLLSIFLPRIIIQNFPLLKCHHD